MSLATESFLKRIKNNKKISFLNIDKEITLVTADVIIRTILSRELEQEEANKIFQAFSRYQKNAGRALIFRFLKLPKKLIQSTLNRDALLIRTWIQNIISNRLEEYKDRKEKLPLFKKCSAVLGCRVLVSVSLKPKRKEDNDVSICGTVRREVVQAMTAER